ncbi:hypothetical protein G6F22_013412 [Rhizopus arrhizus]|nr:hypothetical protein G6F22_013412 [Rhizopus arrhizus]
MFESDPQTSFYNYTVSHLNDHDQYPSFKEFEDIVQDYLKNLSSKKRDKALIDESRYAMVLQVLKDPRNTSISTAQFRFWVKKMFQLSAKQVVCHDGKPVATREQIYSILVRAHREAHHGGRDKTSALVRRRYSWIPKELIARFVRHCPFCISRRNGSQQSPLTFDNTLYHPHSPIYPIKEQKSTQDEFCYDMALMEQDFDYYYSCQYQNGPKPTTALFDDYAEPSVPCMESPVSSMQFPLSTYNYHPVHQDGPKQNTNYSLIDSHLSFTTPPTSRSNSIYYDGVCRVNRTHDTHQPYSPSMSPSSSSTSSILSPINHKYPDHSIYHSFTDTSAAFNLFYHQQTLF